MANHLPYSLFRTAAVFLAVLLIAAMVPAHAEIIKLNSGEIISGSIVEQNVDLIKIDTELGVRVTYFFDEIELINGDSVEIYQSERKGESVTIKLLQAVPVVDSLDEKSNIETFKDFTVIDEQNQSKELSSPFGPTIREMKSDPVKPMPDTGSSAINYLMDRVYNVSEVETVSRSEEYADGESSNVLIRNFNKVVKNQIDAHKAVIDEVIIQFHTVQEILNQTPPNVLNDFKYICMFVFGVYYILFCVPLMKIAKQLGRKQCWLVWVPVVQIFYFIYMANRSQWVSLLFLFPVVNIFLPCILFASILDELNKATWKALLIIFPIINIPMVWLVAFKKKKVAPTTLK